MWSALGTQRLELSCPDGSGRTIGFCFSLPSPRQSQPQTTSIPHCLRRLNLRHLGRQRLEPEAPPIAPPDAFASSVAGEGIVHPVIQPRIPGHPLEGVPVGVEDLG